MEILELLFFAIITYFGIKALWVSTLIIEEKKQRYKAGTHDYYGNKIEDE
jgi:ribosomal protein L23